MTAILYYSRNPNPRLAVATARHLDADVTFEHAATFANPQKFRPLNPSLLLPILVENGKSLWEADAIACRLSMRAGSNFWRLDDDMPDMIRWISWGKAHFVAAIDKVHFELGTKQRYGLGPVNHALVAEGQAEFHRAAAQLDAHLDPRGMLLDSGLCYADFRMASYLPFNDVAGLPLADYRAIARWYARLTALPAWSDPFAGLNAPPLPPIP